MHRVLFASLGALSLFLFNPELSQAQHHTGGASHHGGGTHYSGGGGHFNGTHISGGGAHFSHGGNHFSTVVPHAYHGNHYSGVGTVHAWNGYHHDRDGYYRGGYGFYPGYTYGLLGSWPYSYGTTYNYSPAYTYVAPSYDYTTVVPSYSYAAPAYDYSAVVPSYSYSAPLPAETVPETASATIEVFVPPTAEVWFEGVKMNQTGSARSFSSPPLPPDQTFVYDVRARWMYDGSVIDQTRQVSVQAGQIATVDFTK